METKHTKSELLYIEEHQSCQNYMTTIETGFKYLEFAKNAAFEEDNTTKNYLLFFLKGGNRFKPALHVFRYTCREL